jgi:hypothetical protein
MNVLLYAKEGRAFHIILECPTFFCIFALSEAKTTPTTERNRRENKEGQLKHTNNQKRVLRLTPWMHIQQGKNQLYRKGGREKEQIKTKNEGNNIII